MTRPGRARDWRETFGTEHGKRVLADITAMHEGYTPPPPAAEPHAAWFYLGRLAFWRDFRTILNTERELERERRDHERRNRPGGYDPLTYGRDELGPSDPNG